MVILRIKAAMIRFATGNLMSKVWLRELGPYCLQRLGYILLLGPWEIGLWSEIVNFQEYTTYREKLYSHECHKALSHVMDWCCQAASHIWANVDQDICLHMTSLGLNEFMK